MLIYFILSCYKTTLQPPPYGKCQNKALEYYTEYSRSRCEMECYTNFLLEICQCTDVYMPGKIITKAIKEQKGQNTLILMHCN